MTTDNDRIRKALFGRTEKARTLTEDQEFAAQAFSERITEVKPSEALAWIDSQGPGVKKAEDIEVTRDMVTVFAMLEISRDYDQDSSSRAHRLLDRVIIGTIGVLLEKYYQDRRREEQK